MSRSRRKPPNTSNPEAKALIDAAQAQCRGCRIFWRLETPSETNSGWLHMTPRPRPECTAKPLRQRLRDIAKARTA
jgi:hypothetical protein